MLRRAILSLVAVAAGLAWASESQAGGYFVRGHVTHYGSYVRPHFQSYPDGNFYNNYSTWGNVNPYTGQPGTHHWPSHSSYHYSPYTYSPMWRGF